MVLFTRVFCDSLIYLGKTGPVAQPRMLSGQAAWSRLMSELEQPRMLSGLVTSGPMCFIGIITRACSSAVRAGDS